MSKAGDDVVVGLEIGPPDPLLAAREGFDKGWKDVGDELSELDTLGDSRAEADANTPIELQERDEHVVLCVLEVSSLDGLLVSFPPDLVGLKREQVQEASFETDLVLSDAMERASDAEQSIGLITLDSFDRINRKLRLCATLSTTEPSSSKPTALYSP